jgi:hypothetical protein
MASISTLAHQHISTLRSSHTFLLKHTHHQTTTFRQAQGKNQQITKSSAVTPFYSNQKISTSAHQHISTLRSSHIFLLRNHHHQTTTFRQAQGKNQQITKSSAVTSQ